MNTILQNVFQGSSNAPRMLANITKALLGVSAVAYTGYQSLYTVDGGHRAVMFNRITGVKREIFAEGMHFRLPWFEWPTIYDVRTKPTKISSPTGTKDLQTVNISLRVLYKPDINQLPTLYRELGVDYAERVLPSIVNETLKSIVAQYNAAQLITQREEVSQLIRRNLEERALDFHILLDDVSITHLTFGSDYSAAVEAKQVAQQDAERAKYYVEKALQDKKSAVIKAEGDAQSAKLIGNAIRNNPGFVELRRLQAASEIAKVVSRSQNKAYLDADTLLLNLLKDSGATERIKSSKK